MHRKPTFIVLVSCLTARMWLRGPQIKKQSASRDSCCRMLPHPPDMLTQTGEKLLMLECVLLMLLVAPGTPSLMICTFVVSCCVAVVVEGVMLF